MPRRFKVQFEREQDGRWIAAIEDLPGVLAYGSTKQEARQKVETLARQVMAAQGIK
jgi:predicted RNase H-like HicB family nuclease